VAGAGHGGKRTPLVAAVSRDEGRTWGPQLALETSPERTFAYTSLSFTFGRALLSYYVSDEATGWISSRFRSIPLETIYGEVGAGPSAGSRP
jgi:sialidase-1